MDGVCNNCLSYSLQDVPFKIEAVPKEIKILVERLETEEIIDLFSKSPSFAMFPQSHPWHSPGW